MPTRQGDSKKDAEDSERVAVVRATALRHTLQYMHAVLGVGFVVVLLPIVYILQEGSTAGLWFLVASPVGILLSRLWKPTSIWVRSLSWDPKFNEIVKTHMKGIYSESKSWILGILSIVYVMAIILLLPSNSGTQFPSGPEAMALLSGIYAFSVYALILGPDVVRASNLKRLSKSFNVPERTLSSYIAPIPYIPVTSSIAYASVVIYVFGAFFILIGVFVFVSFFIQSGIFRMLRDFSTLAQLGGGLTFIFVIGGGSLWAAHDLRRMEKTAAMIAILNCIVFITMSTIFLGMALDDPHLSRYFFQPMYLHFIWLWPLPIATAIIIWRNLGKMGVREEMRMYYGKTAKQEKKAPKN